MPTFTHARDRAEVVLDDGRTGTLQHVTRNSNIATVVVQGRRVRVPNLSLRLIVTHRMDGQRTACCGRAPAEIPARDRVTTDPARVTCQIPTCIPNAG